MYTICKRIKQLRLERGMTQKQLADMLDVSPKTISKWETEQSLPDISHLLPLGVVFSISVNELLMPEAVMDPYSVPPGSPEMFPRIRKYGISTETICASTGVDRETVEQVIIDGKFSQHFSDKEKVQTLSGVLSFLDRHIPRLLDSLRENNMLFNELKITLNKFNEISDETIARYARIDPKDMDDFFKYGSELPPEKKLNLLAALFLLNITLNKESPYPWPI